MRPIARAVRRLPGRVATRLGQISSSTPLSRSSGFDRGLPIDRYYIERFLAAHASDIKGRVLEAGDDCYSRKFGGARVTSRDIVSIESTNPSATIVGDLAVPGLLKPKSFDCILLTQALQYVFGVPAALKQIREALRPGGVLLVTVPGVAPISLDEWKGRYYWRFTAASLELLLREEFAAKTIDVTPWGNLYAATMFLHGAAVQEVNRRKLEGAMPEYAIVVTGRAQA